MKLPPKDHQKEPISKIGARIEAHQARQGLLPLTRRERFFNFIKKFFKPFTRE